MLMSLSFSSNGEVFKKRRQEDPFWAEHGMRCQQLLYDFSCYFLLFSLFKFKSIGAYLSSRPFSIYMINKCICLYDKL